MDSQVVTTAEMRAVEEAAFARGVSAEQMMDEAGAGLARTVERFFAVPGRCLAFVGKGHNGGDALVAARLLQERGWAVELHLSFNPTDCSELTRKKLHELPGRSGTRLSNAASTIALDGLLGIGLKLPLREPLRAACREINSLRQNANIVTFAVDIPSGLDSDSGAADVDCVIADFTVAVGFAKSGLLSDRALDYVGRLEIVPLRELSCAAAAAERVVATPDALRTLLPRRKFGAYKNQFGRVGVVAGSEGLTGAAVLCALGALRGGAGLVNIFVNEDIYPVVAAAAPPEAMVRPLSGYNTLAEQPVNVWAVGPGLGQHHADELRDLIAHAEQPMVVDADGLNALAERREILQHCRGPRLLTPHPGEMERIDPGGGSDRAKRAAGFVRAHPVTLLLKG
ncbi:MAG: NAD(P)H-hydrate epimerase, partial [Chthoniobacterales bacterium]